MRVLLSGPRGRAVLFVLAGALSLTPGLAVLFVGNPFARDTSEVTAPPPALELTAPPPASATPSATATASEATRPPRLGPRDRVAFVRANSLHVASSVADDSPPLTSGLTVLGTPVWSPDGARIAFAAFEGTGPPLALFVINADGSGLVKIPARFSGGTPSFSPTSDYLTFASLPTNGGQSVAVVKVDGSALVELSPVRGNSGSPVWSPSGTRIAFLSDRDLNRDGVTGERGRDLYVMNSDGSNVKRLTTSQWRGSLDLGTPSWSPDGSKLVTLRYRMMSGLTQNTSAGTFQVPFATEAEHLYVVGADTDTTLDLTPSSSSGVWAPDGQTLAFVVTRAGEARPVLGLVGANGTNLRLLKPPEDVERWFGLPSWSPDGRMLAIAAQLKDRSWTIQGIDATTGMISSFTASTSQAQSAPAWARHGLR